MADLFDDCEIGDELVWIEKAELDALRSAKAEAENLLMAAYIVLGLWLPKHPLTKQIRTWLEKGAHNVDMAVL